MYPWLIPVKKHYENNEDLIAEVSIERITARDYREILTPACQFFSYSSYVLQTEVYVSIPTPSREAESLVLEQLAPHYKKIMKESIGNKTYRYNLIGLKPKTLTLFRYYETSGKLYSIVPDMVKSNSIIQFDEKYFKNADIREYSIDISQLKPLKIAGTESLYQFLKQTFFASEGVIRMQPVGWKLKSDLIESPSLRSLSTYASKIHITVNLYNRDILGVDIFS
ncbi:hypothetical protein [Tenuibacillus multivorans]|uniref:Uncharacterized protein n=1 Tax=Tenuibacillus multivorans TaxID=237069 RepID=A0A1G9ZQP1_9BACI|nr:hypothetical protein [Tenuibacillus multivorans]GEL78838.1 hypothetical protein TMU01_30730 [Tenuibacillus multivorans]SDN22923.1 hypothetical protein SAMN05216498_1780 [Tenuibacillus multivorans]